MTKEEWQAEKNRLAGVANNAWSNYGHANDVGGYTTGLFKFAKDATEAFDRHSEQEPSEPTITLTQAQAVALWKEWPKQNARAAAFQGSKDVFKQAIDRDAWAFLRLLGAPEDWAGVLVEGVKGEME